MATQHIIVAYDDTTTFLADLVGMTGYETDLTLGLVSYDGSYAPTGIIDSNGDVNYVGILYDDNGVKAYSNEGIHVSSVGFKPWNGVGLYDNDGTVNYTQGIWYNNAISSSPAIWDGSQPQTRGVIAPYGGYFTWGYADILDNSGQSACLLDATGVSRSFGLFELGVVYEWGMLFSSSSNSTILQGAGMMDAYGASATGIWDGLNISSIGIWDGANVYAGGILDGTNTRRERGLLDATSNWLPCGVLSEDGLDMGLRGISYDAGGSYIRVTGGILDSGGYYSITGILGNTGSTNASGVLEADGSYFLLTAPGSTPYNEGLASAPPSDILGAGLL